MLDTTPILTAAWFTPLAIGGVCLAVGGGFVMHMISNRILMMISSVGFLISVLLFAIIPDRVDGHPSTGFLYWAYIFPAMLCGTIGVDITYNVTNVFITTSMPRRLQATAGGLINTLLYLGLAFWLGIAEMAISEADRRKAAEGGLSLRQQYKIGFWIGVAMAGLSLMLVVTIKIGQAAAELTADEKAAQAQREAAAN